MSLENLDTQGIYSHGDGMTTVPIQLPEMVLAALDNDPSKAARKAVESLVVDLYRDGKLDYRGVSQALVE